jgi:endo-1,4-beta-xylanase
MQWPFHYTQREQRHAVDPRALSAVALGGAAPAVAASVQWPAFELVPAWRRRRSRSRTSCHGGGDRRAINQNQSDGRDTVAVDLITRQFNTISPENLLKFQSLHPEPDRFTFDAPIGTWRSAAIAVWR